MNTTEETATGYNVISKPIELLKGTENVSPAAPGHSESTPVTGLAKFALKPFMIVAELQGATGGALDVIIEESTDGAAFYERGHFTQLAAAAAKAVQRFVPTDYAALATVGKDNTTTMTLAAGTLLGGPLLDQMRVRMVAGANTTAGKVQSVKLFVFANEG